MQVLQKQPEHKIARSDTPKLRILERLEPEIVVTPARLNKRHKLISKYCRHRAKILGAQGQIETKSCGVIKCTCGNAIVLFNPTDEPAYIKFESDMFDWKEKIRIRSKSFILKPKAFGIYMNFSLNGILR